MAIASITLALLLIPTSTFLLMFPICQITFAQGNVTQSTVNSSSNDTIVGVIIGGLIGAAATFAVTILNNKHNMSVKKQELEHGLSIELLKHRIDCYAIIFKHIANILQKRDPQTIGYDEIREFHERLRVWANEEKGHLLMSQNSLRLFGDLWKISIDTMDKALKEKGDNPAGYNVTSPQLKPIYNAQWEFREALLHDVGVKGEMPKS